PSPRPGAPRRQTKGNSLTRSDQEAAMHPALFLALLLAADGGAPAPDTRLSRTRAPSAPASAPTAADPPPLTTGSPAPPGRPARALPGLPASPCPPSLQTCNRIPFRCGLATELGLEISPLPCVECCKVAPDPREGAWPERARSRTGRIRRGRAWSDNSRTPS